MKMLQELMLKLFGMTATPHNPVNRRVEPQLQPHGYGVLVQSADQKAERD